MSVEEVRAEMLGWVKSGGHDDLNRFIDRLVLEVQAEMPCYQPYLRSNEEWAARGVIGALLDKRDCGECVPCQARTGKVDANSTR